MGGTPQLTPPQQQPDEDLLALLGLHPAQMQVAHGLASGAIHPQQVLDAATPQPTIPGDSGATPAIAGGSSPHSAPPMIARPPEQMEAQPTAATPAAPAAPVPPPPTLTGPTGMTPRIAPPMPDTTQAPTRLSEDQAELQRVQSTGSGISQFQQRHPVLGTIARIGAGVGSAMFPGIASQIPGTDLHHQVVLNQDRAAVNQDLGEQEKEATVGETGARTAHENAATAALQNPQPKTGITPEEKTFSELIGKLNPQTGKPYTALEAFREVNQAKQDGKPDKTGTFEEQTYDEWKQAHPNGTRMQFDKERKDNERPPEKEPHQMVVGPDGTVIELKPGMKVPEGSKTVTGDLTHKPTADEQRRADLSENLNENLDQLEDIVKRRPELFGPLAGRWTELKGKFGSDDPDIAALQVLEHQIGMAQISAHGMRSAQGISSAAESIMNGLHSGPAALTSAIKTVRNSVKTFSGDVAAAKGEPSAAPNAAPANAPAVGTVEGGYKFKGGDPADKNNWVKQAKP